MIIIFLIPYFVKSRVELGPDHRQLRSVTMPLLPNQLRHLPICAVGGHPYAQPLPHGDAPATTTRANAEHDIVEVVSTIQ